MKLKQLDPNEWPLRKQWLWWMEFWGKLDEIYVENVDERYEYVGSIDELGGDLDTYVCIKKDKFEFFEKALESYEGGIEEAKIVLYNGIFVQGGADEYSLTILFEYEDHVYFKLNKKER